MALAKEIAEGVLPNHHLTTHAHPRGATKGDLAPIRLSGQYGEALAHTQGGAFDHWGLLIEPV